MSSWYLSSTPLVSDTIGVLLKYQDDIARIEQGEGRRILNEVKAELATAAE